MSLVPSWPRPDRAAARRAGRALEESIDGDEVRLRRFIPFNPDRIEGRCPAHAASEADVLPGPPASREVKSALKLFVLEPLGWPTETKTETGDDEGPAS